MLLIARCDRLVTVAFSDVGSQGDRSNIAILRWRQRSNLVQQTVAVHILHRNIADQDIEGRSTELLECVVGRAYRSHDRAFLLKHEGNELQSRGFIFDNQCPNAPQIQL